MQDKQIKGMYAQGFIYSISSVWYHNKIFIATGTNNYLIIRQIRKTNQNIGSEIRQKLLKFILSCQSLSIILQRLINKIISKN